MKLITKEIENAFAKQGKTGHLEMSEIKIVMKHFNPMGAGTWYLYEKLDDDIYMAFVTLGYPEDAECGTVSMQEIEEVRLPFGLKIERDMHFKPLSRTLKDVRDTVKAGGHV